MDTKKQNELLSVICEAPKLLFLISNTINLLQRIDSSSVCVLVCAERNETLRLLFRLPALALPLFSHLVRKHYILL